MIRTVIFDIDGTMYDYEAGNRLAMEAVKEYCLLHLHVDGAAFSGAIRQANRRMEEQLGTSCAAIHNRLIRFQYVLELLNLPLFPYAQGMYRTYWDKILEEMRPYPGLLNWMRQLKSDGISIGVGTNMTADIQYRKLERLGVSHLLSWIVTSEEAGVEKPDPSFFKLCVEKSKNSPGDCLFVGDSPAGDAKGAVESKMKALLFAPLPVIGGKTDTYRTIQSFYECLEPGFMEAF